MQLSTKLSAVSSTLALTSLFGLSPAALADTVVAENITYYGGTTSGVVNSVGSSGGGGLFTFERKGGTSPLQLLPNTQLGGTSDLDFIGICLEFNETLHSGTQTYDLVELTSAPIDANNSPYAPMNSRATNLATLLGGLYPVFGQTTIGGSAITNTNALALQIAVWEIANEGFDSTYNVASGNITFTSSAAAMQAQGWLTKINNGNSDGWATLTNLKAITIDGKQDFVVQAVPIPAAAWLFGSALMGTAALGRRKQKKEAKA